jgi:hypothetical protein
MPWRPPAVNSRYNAQWDRVRKSVLSQEPLCRLCLSTGRTVPATVVDHITPLAEGGTHEQANLQPLCKRCHDSIKTPADVKERKKAEAKGTCTILLHPPAPQSVLPSTVDAIAMRRGLMGWMAAQTAHLIGLAAAEGVASAWFRGELDRDITISMDCDQRAGLLAARFQCGIKPVDIKAEDLRAMLEQVPAGTRRWLEERASQRRARASISDRRGPQEETSAMRTQDGGRGVELSAEP